MWDYVDPEEVTQTGVPNLLHSVASRLAQTTEYNIRTPRSVTTDYHFETPDSYSGSPEVSPPWLPSDLHRQGWIMLPSTYTDAADWVAISGNGGNHSVETGHEQSGHDGQDTSLSHSHEAYHVDTRLRDGRPAILIDPGSVGNLGGDQWARDCAKAALRAGRKPIEVKRQRPLSVTGVGHGSQQCTHNCKLPVMLRKTDGTYSPGVFETPVVPNSELPGLLGLHSMRNASAVLDMANLRLHLCGPGDIQLNLPAGTESYQLEVSPSGHLVLPCSNFAAADTHSRPQMNDSQLSLANSQEEQQI